MLLPTHHAAVRARLDQWFERQGLRPRVAGEFEDSALLKVMGTDGLGIFPGPAAVETEIRQQYKVDVIGRTEKVREQLETLAVDDPDSFIIENSAVSDKKPETLRSWLTMRRTSRSV